MMKNVLHLKAPGNWINDPNGFIYYKGKGQATKMVRMVIFYAEKYNHCGALIFSNLLHMVLMVINVYT